MKSEYHILYNDDGLIDHEWWGHNYDNHPLKVRHRYYHRVDGPAYILYSSDSSNQQLHWEYWILDTEISKKDFNTPGFIDAFILENS